MSGRHMCCWHCCYRERGAGLLYCYEHARIDAAWRAERAAQEREFVGAEPERERHAGGDA